MTTDYSSLVSKVWNYAHVLKGAGLHYGAYIEQVTFLLFLKMDQERKDQLGESSFIPPKWRWQNLAPLSGEALDAQYRKTLDALAVEKGLVGAIFHGAQNKIRNPADLKRVVSMIDSETWIGLKMDVKGAIYEGLLERNAAEVKSGAGQYFTPRPLIEAMVKVVNPKISDTVHDPACGTGGFLLAAFEHMKPQSQDRAVQRRLRDRGISGVDIVDEVVRLCAMNLYLHGLGNGESPIVQRDALHVDDKRRYGVILTNPPFGKKSSYKVIGEDGEVDTEREDYEREDFKFTTSKNASSVSPSPTCSSATSSTWTSSGSRTTAWTMWTACRRRTKLPRRSSKTCRRRWRRFSRCLRIWRRRRLMEAAISLKKRPRCRIGFSRGTPNRLEQFRLKYRRLLFVIPAKAGIQC